MRHRRVGTPSLNENFKYNAESITRDDAFSRLMAQLTISRLPFVALLPEVPVTLVILSPLILCSEDIALISLL